MQRLSSKFTALRDAERWTRRGAILRKRLAGHFRPACASRPLFVLGKQRSGTTMLMYAFHRHPGMLVVDEHRRNDLFVDYRIRSLEAIHGLLERACFPVVCLKPICDSHRLRELHRAFPTGSFIWAYRDFRDVANSSLRKFDSATRAIRLVCTGQPGGGWFREGMSPAIARALQEAYRPTLSRFDLACLVWWARNQIILESGLLGEPNVLVLKYEALVSQPAAMLEWLFARIGIEYREQVARKISPRSIGRFPVPEIDPGVQQLCLTSLAALDRAFHAENPPVQSDQSSSWSHSGSTDAA